jgi:hypothetical protein
MVPTEELRRIPGRGVLIFVKYGVTFPHRSLPTAATLSYFLAADSTAREEAAFLIALGVAFLVAP